VRRWRTLLAVLALALPAASLPAPAAAQRARVEIILPAPAARATEPPSVRTFSVLTTGRTAELVRNGFPARLHYRLERWTAGTVVNDVKATSEWEVIAEYDALARRYRLIRATDARAVVIGEFADLREGDALLAQPYAVPISLPRPGERSYYRLTLDVEAMSLSDLDEVRRWLRGELRPAVRGRRNPGTAVGTGLRTLFVRILGGERVQYEASTGVFRP